jgi:hypothetical protein
MGGGKEKKKTNQMIDQNRQMATGEHQEFKQDLSAKLNQSDAQAQESRDYALGAAGTLAGGNYSVDPNAYMVTPDFGEARDLYRNFASGGGIDEGKMRVAHPIFQDIANNQDIANRMRAGGTYEEFARTGGISDQDRANIRSRATSVIPAYYSRMKAEADRAGALQGGYGPGNLALKSRMARDAVAQSAASARDAELGIADQVRQGRMFGAQGMTGAESSLQGLRLGAGGALDASEANIQNALQRGRMFGTGGIHGISSEEAAIQAANMDRSSGLAVGNMGRMFGRDQAAAGLAANMYAQDAGMPLSYMNLGLGNRGVTYDVLNAGVQNRMQNNPQRDYLGMALGAAGPILSGFAGF